MIKLGTYRPSLIRSLILGAGFLFALVLLNSILLGAPLFRTLFAKTFVILASQMLVTWVFTYAVLLYVRSLYEDNAPGVYAVDDRDDHLDLQIDSTRLRRYFWLLLVAAIGLFITLLIVEQYSLAISLPVFTLWSMVTGVTLALALLSVDESIGARVIGLTTAVTMMAALIGTFSSIDFSFLGTFLFVALLVFLLATIVRLTVLLGRGKKLVLAPLGVIIFVGYLLFDFSRLAQLSENQSSNTWAGAIHIAIRLYLDVVNLAFQLLDLLSD